MKATGIVRRIDDLGRVVIPKEIRRVLRIREGDPLEIYTSSSGEVILKKYSPINELGQFASEFAEAAAGTLGSTVIVSDTDQIIAAAGAGKKEYIDSKINDSKIVVPILSQGDAIGAITIIPKDKHILGDTELKAAEIGAGFLARQMES